MPSLEHNNKVIGESLDLLKYIDNHFDGPALYPNVRCENHLVPWWKASSSLCLSLCLCLCFSKTIPYFCRILPKGNLVKSCYMTTISSEKYIPHLKGRTRLRKLVGFVRLFLLRIYHFTMCCTHWTNDKWWCASAAPLNRVETALSKFDDGPFFLGEFSLVGGWGIYRHPICYYVKKFSWKVWNLLFNSHICLLL